ncbi:GroES-like protein, partial [Aphelenchoides avenae]
MIETIRTAINELVLDKKEVQTATPIQPIWDETKKMRCLVWKGKEDIRYVEHARPCITAPTDILLKVTATTICGSDLHLYKGTFLGMRDGDIPGHEFLGTIEEIGDEVKNFKVGQRVIVGFCITCGECDFCKREEYTACDKTNPTRTVELFYGDRQASQWPTGAYGYSHMTGAAPGGQSEYVRVAFADWNCLPIPDDLPDEKALYLTDIIPTGYHGAVLGDVGEGSVVGIWGLGPIGLMCAQWCRVLGAKRIIGIDAVPERLALARDVLKIDVIDFGKEDVVNRVHEMLGGSLDVAIDCVGFDFPKSWLHKLQMKLGLETDSPEVFTEMFRCVRKFGKVAVVGDYFAYANKFPI